MSLKRRILLAAALVFVSSTGLQAGNSMFEDFENQPANRWEFIADTVMGGVSTGTVAFGQEGPASFARLSGTVSTENRGGFIQFRRKLKEPLPENAEGVRMVVRGNAQRYFIHLRTSGTVLPWQYYQAGFGTSEGWQEIRLPLSSFEPSGKLLRATPAAKSVTSVGVVAYGRDHEALVDVREIGFY